MIKNRDCGSCSTTNACIPEAKAEVGEVAFFTEVKVTFTSIQV